MHGDNADNGKASNLQAFFTFFKSMFGAGILVITHKFTDVGLVLGVVIFLSCAIFVLVTTYMLLDCFHHCSAIAGRELSSYEDLAGFILGKYGRRTIRYSVGLLQLLFCTGFMIVFISNMHHTIPALSSAAYAGLALPPLTLLSWIPDMRDMWIISVIGLVVYIIGVVGLSTYDGIINYSEPDELMDWKYMGVPSYFGVCAYAIEGICLVIPTVRTLHRERDGMLVVASSLVLYCSITVTFAAFTFSAGLGDCDTVTECLDKGFLASGVRLALCAALLLTHPVYIIVVANIIEGRLFPQQYAKLNGVDQGEMPSVKGDSDTQKKHFGPRGAGSQICFGMFDASPIGLKSKFLRFLLVGITCAIAASGIKFSVFSGLVGSVLTSFIGFIMPTVLWWRLYKVVGCVPLNAEHSPISSPLLSGSHSPHAAGDKNASATTDGHKSSLFTLLSATPSSHDASKHYHAPRLFDHPLTPSQSEEDPKDWVYSSFIAESQPQLSENDVILHPSGILKSNSNLFGNVGNSGDESSVDSREGQDRSTPRASHGSSGVHGWLNRFFDWNASESGMGHPGTADEDKNREATFSADSFIDNKESVSEKHDFNSTRMTVESIYELETSETAIPANVRYPLPKLSWKGNLLAVSCLFLGIVAMIAGAVSGIHDLASG